MKKETKVRVSARSTFLPEQSQPQEHRFMWSYDVTIVNETDEIVQLLNRHWRITDMLGHVEEVRGPGVVGLQPVIKPGKEFVYTSFCQLMSPQGTMEGDYEMQTLDEKRFLVDIPKFILTSPIAASNEIRSRLH